MAAEEQTTVCFCSSKALPCFSGLFLLTRNTHKLDMTQKAARALQIMREFAAHRVGQGRFDTAVLSKVTWRLCVPRVFTVLTNFMARACTHTHTHTHTHAHLYTHTRLHTHTHTHLYTYTLAHLNTHTHTHAHTHTYALSHTHYCTYTITKNMCMLEPASTRSHKYINTHTHTHTIIPTKMCACWCMHVHRLTETHTHMCTHT